MESRAKGNHAGLVAADIARKLAEVRDANLSKSLREILASKGTYHIDDKKVADFVFLVAQLPFVKNEEITQVLSLKDAEGRFRGATQLTIKSGIRMLEASQSDSFVIEEVTMAAKKLSMWTDGLELAYVITFVPANRRILATMDRTSDGLPLITFLDMEKVQQSQSDDSHSSAFILIKQVTEKYVFEVIKDVFTNHIIQHLAWLHSSSDDVLLALVPILNEDRRSKELSLAWSALLARRELVGGMKRLFSTSKKKRPSSLGEWTGNLNLIASLKELHPDLASSDGFDSPKTRGEVIVEAVFAMLNTLKESLQILDVVASLLVIVGQLGVLQTDEAVGTMLKGIFHGKDGHLKGFFDLSFGSTTKGRGSNCVLRLNLAKISLEMERIEKLSVMRLRDEIIARAQIKHGKEINEVMSTSMSPGRRTRAKWLFDQMPAVSKPASVDEFITTQAVQLFVTPLFELLQSNGPPQPQRLADAITEILKGQTATPGQFEEASDFMAFVTCHNWITNRNADNPQISSRGQTIDRCLEMIKVKLGAERAYREGRFRQFISDTLSGPKNDTNDVQSVRRAPPPPPPAPVRRFPPAPPSPLAIGSSSGAETNQGAIDQKKAEGDRDVQDTLFPSIINPKSPTVDRDEYKDELDRLTSEFESHLRMLGTHSEDQIKRLVGLHKQTIETTRSKKNHSRFSDSVGDSLNSKTEVGIKSTTTIKGSHNADATTSAPTRGRSPRKQNESFDRVKNIERVDDEGAKKGTKHNLRSFLGEEAEVVKDVKGKESDKSAETTFERYIKKAGALFDGYG